MFCCCEPMGPGFESDQQPGSQVSTFPGDRRFAKTSGNALTAAHIPHNSTAPQYGAPQQATASQYGAAQAPPASTHAEKVVAGTSNLL
jgi:hypothetical protein